MNIGIFIMFSNKSKCKKTFLFIPTLFVYLIIFIVIKVFTNQFFLEEPYSNTKTIIGLIFYFCASMVILTHTLAMITNPGEIDSIQINHLSEEEINQSLKNQNQFFNLYCKRCKKSRPERSHHCSSCNKCFLKMDHHCPWIFNCVGLNNQKYFYLFLIYAVIGDFIATVCLFKELFRFQLRNLPECDNGSYLLEFFTYYSFLQFLIEYPSVMSMLHIFCHCRKLIFIINGGILAFGMTIAIGVLLMYQTNLICKNKTSIESEKLKKNQNTPYFYKNKLNNFKIVLGIKTIFKWFLPIREENKYNDGYNYPKPNIEKFNEIEEKYNKELEAKKENNINNEEKLCDGDEKTENLKDKDNKKTI